MDQVWRDFTIEPEEYGIGAGERITVGLFRPKDGPGVVQLFKAVYGDGYPVRRFYDPAELIDAHETGESYSLTARKANGQVIGHVAVFRSSPFPNLYEGGAGLVLPEYRKAGINQMLMTHLCDRVLPGLGVEETWGEAVCNHITMQKALQRYKFVETGLEVDLMPAEAYTREGSARGRVASLVCFRAYKPRPHTVYLPTSYESELRFLYATLDDHRTLELSRNPLSSEQSSQATAETFAFAQVSRIAVTALGSDFEPCFDALEEELLSRPTRVIQVWLNLACPSVGEAVALLRGRGYFLGGVLPRWFDDDGLLMQKIFGLPDWDGISLFSDRSLEILRLVRSDWESVVKDR